jgi:tellurite resistance protein TerC
MDSRFRRTWTVTYRTARRVAVAVIGATVVLIGAAMLVLPGPGMVTILAGLAILGIEFAFARRWLRRIERTARGAARKVSGGVRRRGAGPAPETAKTTNDNKLTHDSREKNSSQTDADPLL